MTRREQLGPTIARPIHTRANTLTKMLTLLLLLGAPCTRQLLAQDQPVDLTGLSIEDLMKVEVASVYGASKFTQKVTEAPASITIVTSEDIRTFGYRTLTDILKSVRGIFVNYDRNYNYVGFRGFARPGDYNTRILVLLDGHRLNDNVYDSAPIGTDFPLDVDLIDRVEIVRGPSSSIYGTSAFFGVINIITTKAAGMRGLTVGGDAGSFGTYDGRLTYADSINPGVTFLASASLEDSRGHQSLYYREFDTPLTNHGLAENVDGESVKHLFGTLSWNGLSLQGAYGWRKKVIPTASYETVFNDPGSFTVDEYEMVDMNYDCVLSISSSLQSRVFYDVYNSRGDYKEDAYSADSSTYPLQNRDQTRGEWLGAECSYTAILFEHHQFVVGAAYTANLQQDMLNYDVSPFFVNTDVRNKSEDWAIYIQDQFPILSHLSLNAGLRHDHYSTFGGTTNPRGGLLYNPFESTTVKALYGEAFRSPNDYELYYEEGGAQKANPSLRPERIRTGEIVVEQYFGKHHRVAASVFSSRITNLINQMIIQEGPDSGSMVFQNVQRIASRGIEFEVESRLPAGVHVLASYAWQQTEDLADNTGLSNSPQHMAKLNLSAPVLGEKVMIGFETQYVSRRKTLQGNWADPFTVMNLTVSSQRLLAPVGFSFSLYNIFGTIYGDPGAEEHVQDTIQQDGRAFRFQMSVHL